MGKITQKTGSLKTALMKYLSACFVIMILGMKLVTWLTDRISKLYDMEHRITGMVIRNGIVEWENDGNRMAAWLIRNADYLLIPLWVMLCVTAAGYLFYSRELRIPIERLTMASQKIAENDLTFRLDYEKHDEMGRLCAAFEDMRGKFYASNLEIWQMLEERKRLSAAFSHDLRTPLTVLSGYIELMQSCGSQLTPEKQAEILSKMEQQTARLTAYTEQMNAVQKLEDIQPELSAMRLFSLCGQIRDMGSAICADKTFSLTSPDDDRMLLADSAIVLRVCENLAANAVRFAVQEVHAEIRLTEDRLILILADDGAGFSEEALQKADRPFYRGEKDSNQHFGLGLYICRLLCMKCGGALSFANGANGGGRVTACFQTEILKKDCKS